MSQSRSAGLLLACLFVWASSSLADERSTDEKAIRAAIDSYVDAFNRHDGKATAAHWSAAGVFVTPSGKNLKGREELEREFVAYLAESKDVKIDIAEPQIEFLSPSVAVETGIARVLKPEQEPRETEYEAIHIKTADGWKIDSLREQDVVTPASHYEQLKELEWMIGDWVDADESGAVETTCGWTKNQNFITRSFKVTIEDRVDVEGTQIIGWDPAAETIRSWTFDSEGGFGVGAWSRNGDEWTVRMLQVLASGERASSINTMKYVDDNTFTFRSVGREVDGDLRPNIDEVQVVRK